MERRRTKQQKEELRKLYDFATAIGVNVFFCTDEELDGSGGFYLAPDKVYVPYGLSIGELILVIAHELGHAVSERLGEVTKRQHDIYEAAYPEGEGDTCLEKDAEVIRYIEARAVYHGAKIIKELKLKVSKTYLELDNLYTMLSLEEVFEKGYIEDHRVAVIRRKARRLYNSGKTWNKVYKRFLKPRKAAVPLWRNYARGLRL